MRSVYCLRRAASLAAAGATLLVSLGVANASAQAPIALGVNLANAPDLIAPMESYVRLVHRNPAIVMWYQQWSEPLFYSDQLPHVRALGAIPMITWDPLLKGVGIRLRSIAAGRFDSYIKSAARAAAAWKSPIYVRFAHEMNLPASPFGPKRRGDSPKQYVAAWRHVVRIFRRQGATNVEWVWSPNVDCNGKCPFSAYYPGNAWVDWVGLDGYNYSSVDHVPWMSFAQVFRRSYTTLTKLSSKRVMIAETASAAKGGNKARWITQSFRSLPKRFARIRAVVWFNRVKETNWTVNSSPNSLAAWRRIVASAAYAGSASTLLRAAPVTADVTSRASPPTPSPTSRTRTAGRRSRKHHRPHR